MHAKGEIDAVLRVAAVDMPPAFNNGLKQGLRVGALTGNADGHPLPAGGRRQADIQCWSG